MAAVRCRSLDDTEWLALTTLGPDSILTCNSSDRITGNYFARTMDLRELPGLGGLALEEDGRVVSILLFFEQSTSLLRTSFGVVFFFSAPVESWKSIFRDYGGGLLEAIKMRKWAFVRMALPASDSGEMITPPVDAEIWFEISKRSSAEQPPPLVGVRVRLAGPADARTVKRMINRSVFAGLNRFERQALHRISPRARDELHCSVVGTKPLVLIAEAEGQVGCLFGDLQAISPHDGVCRARIIDAYVIEERLGHGVAATLTHAFQRLCCENKIHEMAGTVKGADTESTYSILGRLRERNWQVDTMMVDFYPVEQQSCPPQEPAQRLSGLRLKR